MNIEQLRDYCLSLTGVEEGFPFGPDTLVFKVNEKIFLLASLDSQPMQFNVKCDPEKALQLREEYNAIAPGYHMNKKHWNTIIQDGSVPLVLLRELIDHSYELVSKTKKKAKK
jgi:predicted DNA-binding protein (MmcQ/YjbR family)